MSRLFPPDVLAFFEVHNYGRTAQEMTALLNATFGTSYTREQIKACRARHHWDSGLTGYFEKGHIPHNKGKKGVSYPGSVATQFKKGHVPAKHRPVGSVRRDSEGYIYKKVAEPNKWKMLHVINWEAVHGPLPPGHALIFKDRDRTNCDPDNLILVTRGELAVLNKRGLLSDNPETTETAVALVRLIRAKAMKKKKGKKGEI